MPAFENTASKVVACVCAVCFFAVLFASCQLGPLLSSIPLFSPTHVLDALGPLSALKAAEIAFC